MSKKIFLAFLFLAASAFAIERGDTVYIDYDLQGGVNNPNNRSFIIYDLTSSVAYALLPPTREGYEFLGWYEKQNSVLTADNFRRETLYPYMRPNQASGNKFGLHARWGVVSKEPQQDESGCMLVHDAAELYGAVKAANSSYSRKVCIFIESDIVVNKNVLASNGLTNKGDFFWWEPFSYISGVIEGNGHTISGLYGNVGLVEQNGDLVIQNLGIVDSYFSGENAGSFVSTVSNSYLKLKNVFSTASLVSNRGYVGGLVGYADIFGDPCLDVTFAPGINPSPYNPSAYTNNNYKLTIENSYAAGYLSGNEGGGLVGIMDMVSIKNSFFAGDINVTKTFSGIGLKQKKTCYVYSEDDATFENVFYPKDFLNSGFEGTPATDTEFSNGTVLKKLKDSTNIPIWVQNTDDAYPKLSGAFYDITYKLNGGVNDASNPLYYARQQEVALKPASKENDEFEGWFINADFKTPLEKISSTTEGNQILFAKWKSWYSITYVNDGEYGLGATKNPISRYADSATFVLSEPHRNGAEFEGWFTDSTFTTRVTELPQGNTEDIVLIGKWSGNIITLIYNLFGGTMGDSANPEKVINGETIRFKNPTREGYVFKGWNDPVKGETYLNQSYTVYSVKSDTVYLSAKWTFEPVKPAVDDSGCYLVTNAHEFYYFDRFTKTFLGIEPPTDGCIRIMNDFAVNEDLSSIVPNHWNYEYVDWNQIPFKGTIYGNGHTISGLLMNYYSTDNDKYNGLFYYSPSGKNPSVLDLYIDKFYYNAKFTKDKVLINVTGTSGGNIISIPRKNIPAPLKLRTPKYDIKGRSPKARPHYGVYF